MVRTRLIRTDTTSMVMIHATRAPGERSSWFESAEAGAEGEGVCVVVDVGVVIEALVIKVLEVSLIPKSVRTHSRPLQNISQRTFYL